MQERLHLVGLDLVLCSHSVGLHRAHRLLGLTGGMLQVLTGEMPVGLVEPADPIGLVVDAARDVLDVLHVRPETMTVSGSNTMTTTAANRMEMH